MNKQNIIRSILGTRYQQPSEHQTACAFAPTNIALVKYWGKRNAELNLPITSSLSISLADKGAKTHLAVNQSGHDVIYLNNTLVPNDSAFAKRLIQFLNLFRAQEYFDITISANIPVAAGLASSACGFAALVQVLNQLYGWNLSARELSILARMGSGSASRSLWQGFVEWHAGTQEDGMDSYAEPLATQWPELCVGLLILNSQQKKISSREAMQRTIATSASYANWPQTVANDLIIVKKALTTKDFSLLGKTAESNALAMHATMVDAVPSIQYSLPETFSAMQMIQQLREQGVEVYFTQDAGPNLKLLFLEKDLSLIQDYFVDVEVVSPFKELIC